MIKILIIVSIIFFIIEIIRTKGFSNGASLPNENSDPCGED